MTILFRELLRQPTQCWTQDKLELLPVKELQALCQLVGIARSGTHDQLVQRLLDLTELQRCLRPYYSDLDQPTTRNQIEMLAKGCKGKELKAMCKRAGIFAASTKYGMAAGLLSWSRECLRKGREAYQQARQANAKKPVQRNLF
ncbi:MAG: hypothetical protein MUC48_21285 [Leptolyngbya sp. Prado105]|jgi:hypothetical protein|nr:hypothetical protein [Leptolyngbya sp. Prado105]